MKSTAKKTGRKSKEETPEHDSVKPTGKPEKPMQKPKAGESTGPDERRPQVKADEIYGDTQIPQRGGKR